MERAPSSEQACAASTSTATAKAPVAEIPEAVAAVIDLYAGPLDGVRFPDLDHATLRSGVARFERSAEQVERQLAALAAAQRDLKQAHDQLWQLAQRALAYAQVYAEGNVELRELLREMKLPPRAGADAAPVATDQGRGRGGRADEEQGVLIKG